MGSSFEEFVTDAVDEILAHEDFGRFMAWVADEVPRRQPKSSAGLDEAERRARALRFARAIWNATPLPSNNLRPRPLPSPERNEPCPCGSGIKYKKCCGASEREAAGLDFDPEAMLGLAAERLDPYRAAELSARLSTPAAGDLAGRLLDLGNPRAALALVENRFAEPARATPRDAEALAVLIDCYAELGLGETLRETVERLTPGLPQSLNGVLWEGLARTYGRIGDLTSARAALDKARSLQPENPRLDGLEVTFLLAADDFEAASRLAGEALDRARRERWDLPPATLDFLTDVAADGQAAHRRFTLGDAEPYVARFERWLAAVGGRPVPPYGVEENEDDPKTGRLATPEDLGFVEDAWIAAFYGVAFDDEEDDLVDDDEDDEMDDDFADDEFADDDEELAVAEDDDDELEDDDEDDEDEDDYDPFEEDLWSEAKAETWLAFLESHPEAFDSVAVLSDVAGAVAQIAYDGSPRLAEGLLRPLLDRGVAILDRATAGSPGRTLPRSEPENEPALELLIQAECLPAGSGRPYLDRLLALDPADPFVLEEGEGAM